MLPPVPPPMMLPGSIVQFQYVIVTAEKGNNLKPFSEESNSYTQKKMKNIAEILQSLHRCGKFLSESKFCL